MAQSLHASGRKLKMVVFRVTNLAGDSSHLEIAAKARLKA